MSEINMVRLFANEMGVLKPAFNEYLKEIKFKEASRSLDKYYNLIIKKMLSSDTETFVFGAFDGLIKHPIEESPYPVGFLWFDMGIDFEENMYCHIEHLYSARDSKRKLFKQFMDIISRFSRWYRVNYFTLDAPSLKLLDHWQKMGFRVEQSHMVFRGDIYKFHKSFKNHHYFAEEREVESNGRQIKKQTAARS